MAQHTAEDGVIRRRRSADDRYRCRTGGEGKGRDFGLYREVPGQVGHLPKRAEVGKDDPGQKEHLPKNTQSGNPDQKPGK